MNDTPFGASKKYTVGSIFLNSSAILNNIFLLAATAATLVPVNSKHSPKTAINAFANPTDEITLSSNIVCMGSGFFGFLTAIKPTNSIKSDKRFVPLSITFSLFLQRSKTLDSNL